MKCRNFKNVINAISQQYSITAILKLQPYRSKRKTFNVLYHSIKPCLNWEMEVTGCRGKVFFKTVTGETHSKWNNSIKTAFIDLIQIQNFMGAGTLECKNFKKIVKEINKHYPILLTISLWTYSSGKMTFCVPYQSIEQCLDNDMLLIGDDEDNVSFMDNSGEKHCFPTDELKIAKLDYLDVPNFVQTVNSI